MRVHHLNCGTMRPRGERAINGYGSWLDAGRIVAHCLLIESAEGLVLVDTGIGLLDLARPWRRLGPMFLTNVRPVRDPAETAVRQIEALGLSRRDVRHIVLTHLDADHIGGLADFPDALVHLTRDEHTAATRGPTKFEEHRYRAVGWAHGPHWQVHDPEGEHFFGLPSVRAVVDPEVLLVPLPGHTRGHAGVAVHDGEGWLLHCGDAYCSRLEMATDPRSPVGMALIQRLLAFDGEARIATQRRLRELRRVRGAEVRVFCSHDPDELAELAKPSPA